MYVLPTPRPAELRLNLYPSEIAEKIRPMVDKYEQAFPALLEIPSKDHPYGMQPLVLSQICELMR